MTIARNRSRRPSTVSTSRGNESPLLFWIDNRESGSDLYENLKQYFREYLRALQEVAPMIGLFISLQYSVLTYHYKL